MAEILTHPAFAVVPDQPKAPIAPTAVDEFVAECRQRFINHHTARGFTASYTQGCLDCLHKILRWTGKTIVEIGEKDYEAWCAALGKEGVARNTQRTYQSRLRQVLIFLYGQADIQNDAQRILGRRITLFAHRGNSLVHKVVDETQGKRRPPTYEEVDQFFGAIDTEIERVEIEHPRRLLDLLRDKAMFYAMYVQGVRLDELCASNVDDWTADPKLPEAGRYGRFRVRQGKGSKGSGKRARVILLTEIMLAQTLAWYERDVRPHYTVKPGHENAMFLSERGTRLSHRSVQARMREHLAMAGLADLSFSPHSWRRGMVSHESARTSVEFAGGKAGHSDTATTMIYGHVPFAHQERVANRQVRQQLRDLMGSDANKDG
jgi:site-specific recombinase XerC